MKRLLLLTTLFIYFFKITCAQPGKLDSSFGTNGIVTTDLGEAHTVGTPGASRMLLLPDGSMYVLQGNISKRHADGSLDSSFGINGFDKNLSVFDHIYEMAIAPDGKVVIEVLDSAYNFYIGRYNTNGTWDSSFSKDGKVIIDQYSDVLAVQKNGKIIISGLNGDSYNSNYFLKRYNVNGSIDQTFSGNAVTHIKPAAIAFQKDGKIVVAGNHWHNSGNSSTPYVAVSRYNIDGRLDNTFSNDGIAESDVSGFEGDVAIQTDDKIIVGGLIGAKLSFLRYNTNGTPDKSFAGTGKLAINSYGSVNAVSVFPNTGKILALVNIDNRTSIIRVNTNGTVDSSFHQVIDFPGSSMSIRPDGKIVVAGGFYNALGLARYNANGSPDTTFHGDGTYTEETLSGNTGYKSIAVQKDGKTVAVGSKWNGKSFDFAVSRYNMDGSPDNTFSGDGIQITDFTFNNDYAKAVTIQKDGKIVVAGNALARYNIDGSLDKTFSGDGKQTANSIDINSVAIQSDGKIVVAGGQKHKDGYQNDISIPAVARYNTDGTVDKTFGANGKQVIRLGFYMDSYNGSASSVVIQNDQKIVIAGSFINSYYDDRGNYYSFDSIILVRLNANGRPDTTYNYNGKKVFAAGYAYEGSCAITKQNDDKIVIAGTLDDKFFVGRVNVNGSTDSSFKGISYNAQEPGDTVTSVALQGDGKIVVAGNSLYRFTADGRFDSTFNSSGRQSSSYFIKDMVIANNELYTTGGDRYGTVARYLLDNNGDKPPTVTLTAPANNAIYLAPAAHIKLSAAAADKDGTITKVEFYNGTTLLHTETAAPYGYVWRNVGLGNYTITAKAYDNSGSVTTSAPVHISVVPNKAPVVSIISPADNQTYADTATIHLDAAATDTDGKIANVKFYNGTTLLRTEFTSPYTYNWTNAATGTYTITAVATDNWGARTTSAPVTITVTSSKAMIVSSKPVNNKTGIKEEISIKLSPNPATSIVNLYTSGLQQSKPVTISIMSISGIVLKKVQTSNAAQMQVDVSSLAKGVYTIKIVSGDKVMYKQFVKL